MNSYQAKKLPIVEILSKLGYTPVRKDKGGVEWVYQSPFRKESVPSLFVNIRKNVWNDFGDIGGHALDFVMRYKSTDVRGALAFLDELYAKSDFKPSKTDKTKKAYKSSSKQKTLILDRVLPLKSPILEKYLTERAIKISLAKNYLNVIQFHHAETQAKYFGMGIQNLSNGYEVRNPAFKSVVGPKDISFFEGTQQKAKPAISIFESFIDFLSFLTDQEKNQPENDVLILNSTKLVERAKDFIKTKNYLKIYTFLDNDRAGEQASEILADLKIPIFPCHHIYQGFKDYNEYLLSKKGN